MKVLIACEYSGIVRDAFIAAGHDAVSCDFLPTEKPGPHYQGDVLDILKGINLGTYCGVEFCDLSSFDQERVNDGIIPEDCEEWDLMIAHPDCTYLCSSGLHWNKRVEGRSDKTEKALAFVKLLMDAPIPLIAIENPVGCISTRIRPADQYIQPYSYGHNASKKTGLWLKGLRPLMPTNYVPPRMVDGKKRWGNQTDSGQNKLGPSDDRWKERARTYQGWADAMADQWG